MLIIEGMKKIRNFERHLGSLEKNKKFIICLPISDQEKGKLKDIGFSEDICEGECILPKVSGPATRFNARGKETPLRDKPKETIYRHQLWKRKEFRGRDNTEEVENIVIRSYKRYPRRITPPPSEELFIKINTNGEKFLTSKDLIFGKDPETEKTILVIVNIFLELFQKCEIRNENLDSIINSPTKRLNWNLLPKGKKPWGEVSPLLERSFSRLSKSKKGIIEKRFETINSHEPDFVAYGNGGFSGYVVFAFENKGIYILESTRTENATYIIDKDWAEISKLTKAQIIDSKLHKRRIIHNESWFNETNRLLKNTN